LSEDPDLQAALLAEPEPVVTRKRVFEAVVLSIVLSVVAIGLAGRFGVLTPVGRALIASPLQALSLGQLGKLKVEGIGGDVWRDFTIRRLTISDPKGIWLDARGVAIRWRALELFRRRAHAESISIKTVTILRSPELGPSGPPGTMPASVLVDHLSLNLLTDPAVSATPGRFAITGNFDAERDGGLIGAIDARSQLRTGDGASAKFTIGVGKQVAIEAHAIESGGGALAGSAGLAANQPFRLELRAVGAVAKGVLFLRATSGSHSIAEADGLWNGGGGSVKGRFELAASRLSSGWTRALGPELRFNAWGVNKGRGLYDMAGQANADNLALTAAGTIDPVAWSARDGLAVRGQVKDLARFLNGPIKGAGVFDGRWSGDPHGWRLAGRAGGQNLQGLGYGMTQAAGPASLELAKHELRLDTTLDGSGGKGQGLIAALAGDRPRLALQATRLVDGRILIHSLKIDGYGLKLQAEGDRGLFGGLTFKGALQASNLVAARVGAKGSADAHWTAAQSRAGEPWKLSLDARGDGFAVGLGELDRLMGPRPTLRMQATYGAGDLKIEQADVVGAAATASGAGVLGKDGLLKLAFKWDAQGPVNVGPIEVAGRANGTGDLVGPIGAPRVDLLADLERIDLPGMALKPAHVILSLGRIPGPRGSTVDGAIELTASSDYGPARAKALFSFAGDGVDLKDIDAAGGGASAKGDLSLRRSSPSAADLTVAAGPGAFVSQGRLDGRLHIIDQAGSPVGDLTLNGSNLAFRDAAVTVTTAHLDAKGPLGRFSYKLTADGIADGTPLKLAGSGVGGIGDKGYQASFEGSGRVRRADFHTLQPALFSVNGADQSAKLVLALGGGNAQLESHRSGQAMKGQLVLTGVDLSALGENLAGRFNANVSVSGQGAHLDGVLDARMQGARSRDAPSNLAMDGTIHAVLAGPKLSVDATGIGARPGDHAQLSIVLPAVATAAPFRIAIDRTRPVEGRFSADGELQPIWDLFFGGERSFGGHVSTQGTIGGDLNGLKFGGHIALNNGSFEDAGTGLKLRNLVAEVDMRDDNLTVNRFSAQDAHNGTLTGEGHLNFANGGSSTLSLTAHGFQLLDNEQAKATATGLVTVVRGADGKAQLSGKLTIDRADISTDIAQTPPGVTAMDVVERNKPVSERELLQRPMGRGPLVGLDIKIRAARNIFVKGLGLSAEMSLDASVAGTTATPILQGSAHVVRGDYDLAGKRFTIDDSGVVYLATSIDRVRLDLSASRDDPSLTAIIRIQGTAAKPQVTLTSTPSLPSDEVLSQVLFGRSAAQLSPVEAAQLAASVTSLATGGGFDVMGGLRNFARLDRLALGGGENPATVNALGGKYVETNVTVSGGKYINNRVYLELTGGGRLGPSAQVEVRANKALSFISQLGGETGAKLEVRWKIDYGKPKVP
jgi:translocation and assembly module TamB